MRAEKENLPSHKIRRATENLLDEVKMALQREGIRLRILTANPMSRQITCQGDYPDILLAKKLGKSKDWEFVPQG